MTMTTKESLPKFNLSKILLKETSRKTSRAKFLPNDDATLQYIINDSKFLKETSLLILEPQRPAIMTRSSSLSFIDYNQLTVSPPHRGRTSSLNIKDSSRLNVSTLRKRPSERNFTDAEQWRSIEWNFRKQNPDFPSNSIIVSVSPKGKRCDPHYLDDPELACRCLSSIIKGYIETTNNNNETGTSTPTGHKFNIFERSTCPNFEIIDIESLTKSRSSSSTPSSSSSTPASVNRKLRKQAETPTLEEIYQFIHYIYTRTQMESECLIISLVYIERALYGPNDSSSSSSSGVNMTAPSSPSSRSSASSSPFPTYSTTSSNSVFCRTPSPTTSENTSDSPFTPQHCPMIENLSLSTANWKAVVITSLLLASKIWDDFSMINSDFSEICEQYGCLLDVQRLNELEKSFLVALDYRVFVKGPEYSQVYFRFQNILDRLHGWLIERNNQNKRQKQQSKKSPKKSKSIEDGIVSGNILPRQRRNSKNFSRRCIPSTTNMSSMTTTTATTGSSSENMNLSNEFCLEDTQEKKTNTNTTGTEMNQQTQLATLLSRSMFDSIYSWFDEQIISPKPTQPKQQQPTTSCSSHSISPSITIPPFIYQTSSDSSSSSNSPNSSSASTTPLPTSTTPINLNLNISLSSPKVPQPNEGLSPMTQLSILPTSAPRLSSSFSDNSHPLSSLTSSYSPFITSNHRNRSHSTPAVVLEGHSVTSNNNKNNAALNNQNNKFNHNVNNINNNSMNMNNNYNRSIAAIQLTQPNNSLTPNHSTSDLFGALQIHERNNNHNNSNHNNNNNNHNSSSSNSSCVPSSGLCGSVMNIFENQIKQYKESTELGDQFIDYDLMN